MSNRKGMKIESTSPPARVLTEAQRQLVADHAYIGKIIAKRYRPDLRPDVESLAYEAIVGAALTYDPARGAKFSTHATNAATARAQQAERDRLTWFSNAPRGKAMPPLAGEVMGDDGEYVNIIDTVEGRDLTEPDEPPDAGAMLRRIFALLPNEDRALLRWLADGETHEQIGDRLGVTRQSASERIYNAIGRARTAAREAGIE